ncbi:MAG: 16S rRNA (guanine(527)-N(7))-methyltransferase RsmG [Chloroflexi bacterium]|nr:16S rRNA (guanine(527)-N(7))-methyltransferase RsmG [Chloroflexota bacterium]MBU1746251.1 16S rRNA (guanine(527)-N(7))-methyltransferase RsmG [Chloroflexota bacterium]
MDLLADQARQLLDLDLSPAQLAAFRRYADELRAWNARAGLTAITDDEAVQVQHFLDSLTCLLVWPAQSTNLLPPQSAIDIGTGAGFPGLPLRIVRPDLRLTLVESVHKKADFLRHVAGVLGLDGVTVLAARAEDVSRDPAHRERYDVALARAVADLRVLVEYALPLLRVGGVFIAQKTAAAVPEELAAAGHALDVLGGSVSDVIEVTLPGLREPRALVVIAKTTPTPAKYPRRAGMPAKRPL